MYMKYFLLIIGMYCLTSCQMHVKEGLLVKDSKGHVYRLIDANCYECYELVEEDTIQLKNIQK